MTILIKVNFLNKFSLHIQAESKYDKIKSK